MDFGEWFNQGKKSGTGTGNSFQDWMGQDTIDARLEQQQDADIPGDARPPLPSYAKGYDTNGNPYFGEGFAAIEKKWWYNFTKDMKDVTDGEWDDIHNRWNDFWHPKQNTAGKTFLENEAESFGLLTEHLSKSFQDKAQGEGFLADALKWTGATTAAILDVFSVAGQKAEQALGAASGFRDAANQIESPLPNLGDNAFTRLLEATPLGLAYDVARVALSPSQNKWGETGKKIADGWNSGRIFYSTLLEPQKKEEFERRFRAGEDPGLLAIELANPWAELIGQGLLDPLNVVGWFSKSAKTAKQLNAAVDAMKPAMLATEVGQAAFKASTEAVTDVDAAKALGNMVAAQMDAVSRVTGKSRLLNVGYGNELNTSSRVNSAITLGKERLGNMAMSLHNQGMSYDGIAEGILNGIRSVSSNADDVRKGLAGLSKLPNANVWLSEEYIESFTMLNRMMTNADGVVDGGALRKFLNIKDPTEFAQEAEALYRRAAVNQFPDVEEMASAARQAREIEKSGGTVAKSTAELADKYNKLPNHVKVANTFNEALKKFTIPVNKALFSLYFNLQGGPAIRNWISNLEMALIDQGPGVLKGGIFSSKKQADFLRDVYGNLPESAQGFKSMVADATERKAWGFGKIMESGEQNFATKIVAKSVRDTLDKMLPKALPDLRKAIESGVLTEKQSAHLLQLIRRNNYNVRRGVEEFNKIYKVGRIEEWRNLNYVGKFERETLEAFDLMDEIEDLARRGANSTDEIEEQFAKLYDEIDKRSDLAIHDPIGIGNDHPGIESWGDLTKAVEDGHLSPDEHKYFTAVMEAQEQSRLEYETLLDDMTLKAMQSLSAEGNLAEAAKIGEEMKRVRNVVRRSGPATAKKSYEITQDAWRWTEEVNAIKRSTPGQLENIWRRAKLSGDPPAGLTKKVLLNQLWSERHDKVTDLWNSSFDALVSESETVLKQLEDVVDATELKSMASRTRYITQKAQAIRSGAYRNGALKIYTKQDINELAKAYNVTTDEILQTINNRKGTAYKTIDDVETHDILKVIDEYALAPGAKVPEGVSVPPPHPIGHVPTMGRVWNESSKGLKYVLDSVKNQMTSRFGRMTSDAAPSPQLEKVLQDVIANAEPKMEEAKMVAARIARENRNFTLLNYGEKTYLDNALSMVFPFQFFYNRSYRNWISRIATNPEIVSKYAQYRQFLEKNNKDVPSWYKQQLNINPLDDGKIFGQDIPYLGVLNGHPLYVNLEQMLNPLYGITGTDYNDPHKRTNAVTATIDDMNKFGPTMYAPIQLAIAAMLYMNGETDAAARWGGRVIPQTNTIKAVSSLVGKPIELDPAVHLFSGGIDVHDRNRMAYAVPKLAQEGYSMAQIMEEFHQQEGETWDKAYRYAVESRAASNILSFFGGPGIKPRTDADVVVEKLQTDLNKMYAMSDYMTPEQFRMRQEQIRQDFPPGMVDTILLARKGGDQRDASYAYSVLGRIPPGDMTEVFKSVGLSNDEIDKFYKSKGFTSEEVTFTPQEKARFMSTIVDLGAMLEMPPGATREEWTEVIQRKDVVTQLVRERFGEDIQEKVDLYYDLKETDADAATVFLQEHPEVAGSLQYDTELRLNDDLLVRYYGSLSKVELYYKGIIRQQLEEKYGPEVYALQSAYYETAPGAGRKAFLRKYPQLGSFWNDKSALKAEMEPLIYSMGSRLKDPLPAEFRDDFDPQSPTQETLFDALQPRPAIPSWEEVSRGMPEWLQVEIANYAENGRPLSEQAANQLDYMASAREIYDGEQLLHLAVLSMMAP